jgi:2-keto-3-deoxy-L-rhamnonate aldolase RhmA
MLTRSRRLQGLPKGKRSLYQVYNEHAAIIMQIESKKGCENAHEILAVPGGESCKD